METTRITNAQSVERAMARKIMRKLAIAAAQVKRVQAGLAAFRKSNTRAARFVPPPPVVAK
jgi:hypothetical protein